jgi:tRNA threonylcarbamoyladenosine modification (KEOPS) complex  Pcc1 subunit
VTDDHTGQLRIRLDTREEAAAVAASIAADDDAYVSTRTDGVSVIVTCRAPDVAGLRRAVDDALAALGISEDLLDS